MQIDEGLDTGPLLLSRALAIGPEETAAELEPRLARLGGELLVETLAGLERGTLTPVPQDPARATLAPLLRKEDGRVDWTLPAHAIALPRARLLPLARRLHARTTADCSSCSAFASVGRARRARAPGDGRRGVGGGRRRRVRRRTRACSLEEVQPESRKAMPAAAWAQGARLEPGARLG